MFQANDLPLNYERMRTLVLDTLREGGGGQLAWLRSQVVTVAMKQGLIADPNGPPTNTGGPTWTRMGYSGSEGQLSDHDFAQLLNIVWDLIVEGVVRPGSGDGLNNDFPFMHVTDRGQVLLRDGPAAPYDPDGYLRRLSESLPGLDPVIVTYLGESLHTFRIGCLLSSTIALGCASEKALLLLIAAYGDSLPESRRAKFKANTDNRMIKRQFDEFRKVIDGELRARLPARLEDGLDVEMNALFDFIRVQRNDAGHPTGRAIERERAYANLLVFPVYLKRAYAIRDWVVANPLT